MGSHGILIGLCWWDVPSGHLTQLSKMPVLNYKSSIYIYIFSLWLTGVYIHGLFSVAIS